MDENPLDREMTFEQLELPLEFEMDCAKELEEKFDDGLPYAEEFDPDAEYIKAVAAGEYWHEMPKAGPWREETVKVKEFDERTKLMGFADMMGWRDFSEEGYLKAVVMNKPGKAAVIKDVTGIDG